MAKYLDYEDVRSMLENLGGCGGDFDTWNEVDTWDDAIDTAISELNSIPAADVQEVRHGEWEIDCSGYYPYCSNCKEEPDSGVMSDYCPNCGARMDGEENG